MSLLPTLWSGCALVALLASCTTSGQVARLDGSHIRAEALTQRIQQLTDSAHVHGLAVAVFNRRQAVYTHAFGVKRTDTKEPLQFDTEIYGASLSKAVFAVLVMKLVEEGQLALDEPLQHYLPQPIYTYKPQTRWHDNYADLRTDTLYARITARMCLSHTTGFPNWRWYEPDQKLRVLFRPGSRYSYSGEGLVYLQVVLEKKLGRPLEDLMQEKIFGPLGMRTSSYHWLPQFEANYCFGHDAQGKVLEKDKDNEPRSASTLETTPADYTRFMAAVLQRKIISPASWNEIFRPQVRIRSVRQMGPLARRDSTLNDNIALSYGLGWGVLQSPYGPGAFKEGHGDGFQHYSIVFPKQGIGVLLMTNSDNGESAFPELLRLTIGDRYTPVDWENYVSYRTASPPPRK
ncbi:serine hydrolase domain-containing protein [Hymenobacter cheonanensis]|uniref:serine hydrolase domain-containing protein n=1 Tax=Hymenobacter sp. CA2-7 TaxID=3063993 RepID=UPI002714443B|nr:serine hydrolase domain-containing protein [Hymenobacter sp. CA2-7]MDO7885894.1 serine hydrolase domain-containing protein [Hymenobacter sp. CA2-7]